MEAAAEALWAAHRPVILAGAGTAVAGATEHLRLLAELLPARVATTPRGKGVFPEDHELSLGVLGLAGHRAAGELLLGDSVDVLLTVGASLDETSTFGWDARLRPGRALIQVDIDPDRIGRSYPVDIALVGHAQAILAGLVDDLRRRRDRGAPGGSVWGSAAPPPSGEDRYDHPELRRSTAVPQTPQRWRVELDAVLPDDAILFSDIGGHMLFNLHDLEIRARRRFVLNLGFGSMGHGTIAPIGAALANPGRPVIAIVGDACFTMNGMDLLTAREYEVPVLWIVENNGMHGVTWHASDKISDRRRKLECIRYRRPVEVAAIARAMGLAAFEVERPGELVGPVPPPRGLLSQSHRVDGSQHRALVTTVPGGSWWDDGKPVTWPLDRKKARHMFLMLADRGKEVVVDALARLELRPEDVQFYAAHQATIWFRRVTQQHIGLTGARSADTFPWAGTLSAANIPLVLATAEAEGLLLDGDLVAMYSGGTGMTWSASILRWGR